MKLKLLLIVAILFSCTKKSTDQSPGTNNNTPPVQPVLSAADLITGTYSGSAQRWYAPTVSTCTYSPSSVSLYTKSGNASIIISKLTDTTVSLIVKSLSNNFQIFPSSSVYTARVHLVGGKVIVDDGFLLRGNTNAGYPYGPISLTFPTISSVTGTLDLSYSLGSNSCMSYYAKFDGVLFNGAK